MRDIKYDFPFDDCTDCPACLLKAKVCPGVTVVSCKNDSGCPRKDEKKKKTARNSRKKTKARLLEEE